MKRFLTVLLIIAVMFTFSFGSAMAATEYQLEDYVTVFTAEKTAQLGYLESAKKQAIGTYTFDDNGFEKVGGIYQLAAYEAAADKVIADAAKAMDAAIDAAIEATTFRTETAPDKTVVSSVVADLVVASGFKAKLEAETETLNKTQAPLTKAYVESKLAVDLSKYDATEKKYEGNTLTAVQYVGKLIDVAKEAIATAAKEETDAGKITGYVAALNAFEAKMADVKTIADEAYESNLASGSVEAAVEQYAKDTLDAIATALNFPATMGANDTVNLGTQVVGDLKAFWEADAKVTNKGELFGVAVANITKVTRTEVMAINDAYKAAVASAKKAVITFADGNPSKVTAISNKLNVLANAMAAVEKYEEVKALGEKYKGEYYLGIKVYNDAAVDAAVKAAEALVYADLNGTFADADEYIDDAASAEKVDLYEVNFELQKFEKAIEDAAKKMYEEGTGALIKTTPTSTKLVSYGDNKTAEADKVYLEETYAYPTEWAKIAKKTVKALDDAQSYDEIASIMSDAAAKFAKLLTAANKADVEAAITAYQGSLESYGTLKKSLVDSKVYPDAIIDAAVTQGKAVIEKAITVDGVKAAYEEAKAIVDGIKTKDEIEALYEAFDKQVGALPYTALLTVADKAAVKAAYDAFDALANTPGADVSKVATSKALLQAKYDKVNELEAKAIEEEAKALNKKIAKLPLGDAGVAALQELKAEAEAVVARAEALADEIEAVNEDYASFLSDVTLDEADDLADKDFASNAAQLAVIKLAKAVKEGATVAEMKEALDAFNALTDRQKYVIDEFVYVMQLAKVVEEKLAVEVQTFKIKASSTAKKGSITVKWTVNGETAAADGFQVWKSTKKNSGFKKAFTTTKTSYKNSKGLKKGTKYYYKVRAYKVVDGKNVYSDWSNKAYRTAK